jgi:hypothetical protein
MTKYKVLSNRLSRGKLGSTLDSDLLDGCNIKALIEAGHIAEVSETKFSKKETITLEKVTDEQDN